MPYTVNAPVNSGGKMIPKMPSCNVGQGFLYLMMNLHLLTASNVLSRFGVLWVRQLVQEIRGRTEQETQARCIETPRQNHQQQKVILMAHGRHGPRAHDCRSTSYVTIGQMVSMLSASVPGLA